MKDKFGKVIKVNDMVVYPVRRKSQTLLKSAIVLGIEDGHLICKNEDGFDTRAVTVRLRHPDRCAIVEVD